MYGVQKINLDSNLFQTQTNVKNLNACKESAFPMGNDRYKNLKLNTVVLSCISRGFS